MFVQRPRSWFAPILLAGWLLCCALFGPAHAADEQSIAIDYLARRVVAVFDFEERAAGNFERMPRHWFPVRQPGFPKHTADRIRVDDAVTRSGAQSLAMTLNGGSAAAVLEPGAIVAVPGADYAVAVHVRTEDFDRARVRMTGYFLDQHKRRIEPSVTTSDPAVSEGEWSRLELRLRGDFDQAAWIVLRLEALQPAEFQRDDLGVHEVKLEDIGATVWFDDLAIYQVPRLAIATNHPTNIIRDTDPPTLEMTTRDFTGQRLETRVRVHDMAGRRVSERSHVLDGRRNPRWQWRPDLPGYGWYWADMRVYARDRTDAEGEGEAKAADPGTLVGRRQIGFLWLRPAPQRGGMGMRRFGLVGENLPANERRLLPAMMRQLGTRAAVIDLWQADQPAADLVDLEHRGAPVIDQLLLDNQHLIVSMPHVPAELAVAANTDRDRPWAWLAAGDAWRPYLQAALVRYGQRIKQWQVGAVGTDEPFFREDLEDLAERMAATVHRYVPDGEAVMPWSAAQDAAVVPEVVDALLVHVPATVRPMGILAHAAEWYAVRDRFRIALQPLAVADYSHAERAEDLALRMIHAWAADPEALYLPALWHVPDSPDEGPTPDPVLGVWTTLAEHLAGRRVVTEMHLAAGVRTFVLEGSDGSGALVIWNEAANQTEVMLDLFLGDEPVIVDLWGNRMPVPREGDKHRLPVTTAPRIIEGIDPKLARFRAGFRFEPGFIESSHEVHEVEIAVTNPWGRTLNGRLRFEPPEGWRIQPALMPISIPAGQTVRVPLSVNFPVHETAGEKMIDASIRMTTDRRYELDLSTPVTIGLKAIEYDAALNILPHPEDPARRQVVVTTMITNRGDEARSLFAHASAPDRPRKQTIINQLPPGESVIRRFRFDDAASLSGRRIRVGLREVEGNAMLNDILEVP